MLSARLAQASCFLTPFKSVLAAAATEVAVRALGSCLSCHAGWQQWAASAAEGAERGAGGADAGVDDAPSRALHEGASSRALVHGNH